MYLDAHTPALDPKAHVSASNFLGKCSHVPGPFSRSENHLLGLSDSGVKSNAYSLEACYQVWELCFSQRRVQVTKTDPNGNMHF